MSTWEEDAEYEEKYTASAEFRRSELLRIGVPEHWLDPINGWVKDEFYSEFEKAF